MRYAKIHAYVRPFRLERVEQRLLEIGVRGFSYCRVKGMGEYVNCYDPDHHVEHARFEIFVPEELVDEAVEVIIDAAATHQKGDGVVAVLPVTHYYRIRTEEEITADADDAAPRTSGDEATLPEATRETSRGG